MKDLKRKIRILFRLRMSPWDKMYYRTNGKEFKEPKWWTKIMCTIGRHDWDLDYMGPSGSSITCNDCNHNVKSNGY